EAVLLSPNAYNKVDCAIAEITGYVDPLLPDGFVIHGHEKAVVGRSVMKYGKATGKTEGAVVDVKADVLVHFSFGTFKFTDQILIDGGAAEFARSGDSGAALL